LVTDIWIASTRTYPEIFRSTSAQFLQHCVWFLGSLPARRWQYLRQLCRYSFVSASLRRSVVEISLFECERSRNSFPCALQILSFEIDIKSALFWISTNVPRRRVHVPSVRRNWNPFHCLFPKCDQTTGGLEDVMVFFCGREQRNSL